MYTIKKLTHFRDCFLLVLESLTKPKGCLGPDPAARSCPTPFHSAFVLHGCGTLWPLGIRSLYDGSARKHGSNKNNLHMLHKVITLSGDRLL